jgi:N-acetyl-anhydromuramyl-L-alanine amidase AmpD
MTVVPVGPRPDSRPHESLRLAFTALVATVVISAPTSIHARSHGRERDPSKVTTIVVHTVGGPACIANTVQFQPIARRDDDTEFWQRLLKSATSAEGHLVIGRNGKKAEVMPFTQVAYHTVGINEISIGIELVHRGDGLEEFEEPQIAALIETIKDIRGRFPNIPIEHIIAHGDIDQRTCPCAGTTYRRRQDPGANFPMERVRSEARGPDENTNPASTLPRLSGPAPASACVTIRR